MKINRTSHMLNIRMQLFRAQTFFRSQRNLMRFPPIHMSITSDFLTSSSTWDLKSPICQQGSVIVTECNEQSTEFIESASSCVCDSRICYRAGFGSVANGDKWVARGNVSRKCWLRPSLWVHTGKESSVWPKKFKDNYKDKIFRIFNEGTPLSITVPYSLGGPTRNGEGIDGETYHAVFFTYRINC